MWNNETCVIGLDPNLIIISKLKRQTFSDTQRPANQFWIDSWVLDYMNECITQCTAHIIHFTANALLFKPNIIGLLSPKNIPVNRHFCSFYVYLILQIVSINVLMVFKIIKYWCDSYSLCVIVHWMSYRPFLVERDFLFVLLLQSIHL